MKLRTDVVEAAEKALTNILSVLDPKVYWMTRNSTHSYIVCDLNLISDYLLSFVPSHELCLLWLESYFRLYFHLYPNVESYLYFSPSKIGITGLFLSCSWSWCTTQIFIIYHNRDNNSDLYCTSCFCLHDFFVTINLICV